MIKGSGFFLRKDYFSLNQIDHNYEKANYTL